MRTTACLTVDCRNPRESLSTGVVDALAEANGVEPCELEMSLYRYIDPGALDGLLDSSMPGIQREGQISFPVESFLVTIDVSTVDTAEIRVEPQSAEADETSPLVAVQTTL